MDELINQLNNLDINKELSNDSIDLICESIAKISIDSPVEIKREDIEQISCIISTLPLTQIQIKKLDCVGLLIAKLIRKIKCVEFKDAFDMPKYIY